MTFASAALGFALLAVFYALVLALARRDWARADALDDPTAILLWPSFLLQGTVILAGALGRTWPVDVPVVPAVVAGGCLTVLGTVFYNAALVRFDSLGQLAGTHPGALLTEGPYALSRHPQYVGWALALIGIAVAGRSAFALGGAALSVVALLVLTRLEERRLALRFGEAWQRYCSQTPRLLGRRARGSVGASGPA